MLDRAEPSERVILITGVAGFIGSQLADVLLTDACTVIGVDDFSRGTEKNLRSCREKAAFEFHEIDLIDERAVLEGLAPRLRGRSITEVWHLAANSDIPAGIRDPRVDHGKTFMTTFNTLLLMRELGIPTIAFASTSAVYGEHPDVLCETTGPLLPISNYGAMKLASEALISAAVESYLKQAFLFRFPNVLGPRLTHGIIYDLLNKLKRTPGEMEVLGDGKQQKPYCHVSDLIEAMLFIRNTATDKVNLYNIGPPDEGTTVASIAEAVIEGVGLNGVIRYTGGDRGWVGDVPRFRYSSAKLSKLGWSAKATSIEVVRRAVAEAVMAGDLL